MYKFAVFAVGAFVATLVGAQGSSASSPQQAGYCAFSRPTDCIQVLGNTHFNQGDFTYEMRIWIQPESPLGAVFYEWQNVPTGVDKALEIAADGRYIASACAATAEGNCRGTLGAMPTGRWLHLAWVHRSEVLRMYIDGRVAAEHSIFGCYSDAINGALSLGWSSRKPTCFRGRLDWFRISGVARYNGAFVPPTESSLVMDGATQLLLKFNEPAGTTALLDESPNHFVTTLGQPGGGSQPSIINWTADCNGDGLIDAAQIDQGDLEDANHNDVPDICELSVTGAVPPSVPSSGGTGITIKGNNFPANPTVLIGGVPATDVVRLSATRITATSPTLLPGMTSISVNGFTLPDALYIRPECGSDLDQNGTVDAGDISIILLDFGPCYEPPAALAAPAPTPLLADEPAQKPTQR